MSSPEVATGFPGAEALDGWAGFNVPLGGGG